jgi:hypothetical protein
VISSGLQPGRSDRASVSARKCTDTTEPLTLESVLRWQAEPA